jgi:hypothetical protein
LVAALFWLVVRWIAVALIGVAAGSAGAVLGFGRVILWGSAVALLLGGVFVFASIVANNANLLSSDGSDNIDLVGVGLLRATYLGFLGAGLLVGSTTGNESIALVAGLTGSIAVLLSLGAGPAGLPRLW